MNLSQLCYKKNQKERGRMNICQWKPKIYGGLAALLVMQPLVVQAGIVSLPTKVTTVNYPKSFNQQIEEVAICLTEAEMELYSSKVQQALPELSVKDNRSCREILETKSFAHNIQFSVNYEIPYGEEGNPIVFETVQEVLTILDKPLKLNDGMKSTETLEIALRLFVELNSSKGAEVAQLHEENDMLDVLYLRLYNLLYHLPKAQGHPLMLEFMKDIRDSFLRVKGSQFFRALISYAYRTNPDKELEESLARYVLHLEHAGRGGVTYIPDEDEPLSIELNDETPIPVDPEEMGFEDLEQAWSQAFEEVFKEELKENEQLTVQIPNMMGDKQDIQINYELQDDQCLKIIQTYQNGKLIKKETEKISKADASTCGDFSAQDMESTSPKQEVDLSVYYRYGGKSSEWQKTSITLNDDLQEHLTYSKLGKVLTDIATTHGLGSYEDGDRRLFVLDGKAFILNKYSEPRFLFEINEWLKEQAIPLEFGRSPEQFEKPAIGLDDL